jgi:Branched-chain amino acid transport protein (AzlD)
MSELFTLTGPLGAYFLVVLVGFLPSEIWRVMGVFLSRKMDEQSEILVWVRMVATALLAGIVAKIVLAPSGALAAVPLIERCASLVVGLAGYFLLRRSVFAGVLFGEVSILAMALLMGR